MLNENHERMALYQGWGCEDDVRHLRESEWRWI